MTAISFRRAVAPVLVAAALAAAWAGPSVASSHREAPFIATQPQVDATDFYMFRSYEPGRDGYVTLVANYLPLQDPYGGPNYFKLDPNAVYEIHVTNGGSAVENITFQFRFQTTSDDNQLNVGGKMVSIPLVQNGSGRRRTAQLDPALNVHEKYTIGRHPRPAACGITPAGQQPHGGRHDVRQAGRLHRHEDDRQATSPTRTSTSTTSAIPGVRAPAASSSASARIRSSSTWARRSTS